MEHMLDKTPVWVWILLVLIIKHGIQAFKDHQISLTRLAISPLLFTLFSLYTVHEAFQPSLLVHGTWVVSWIAGMAIALAVHSKTPPRLADRDKKIFLMSGTPLVLILSLLIFGSRFALLNASVFDPALMKETPFELVMLVITGGASGFLIGKLVSCLKLLKS